MPEDLGLLDRRHWVLKGSRGLGVLDAQIEGTARRRLASP